MRVLFISTYPPDFCGIGSYMHDFLNAIKNQLDDYLIISNKIKVNEADIKVIRLLDSKNPFVIFKALSRINEFRPDVVHIQYISTFFQPWMPIFMNLIKFPTVVESHEVLVYNNSKINKLRKIALLGYEKIAYNNATKIIVHNELMKKRLVKYYKIPHDKIDIVDLGVNTDVNYKKDYHLKNKLLFFGFIHFDKGIETLIEGFRLVREKKPETELILMGGSRSSDALEYIENMRTKYKLNINLTGYVKDIGEFMRESDILIIPHKELSSHSLAITEAMPYGIPIVASNVPGLRCQVKNEVTGKLFQAGSGQELANVVLDLMNDEKKREKLGMNARIHAEKELSWNRVCSKILKDFEKII